MTKPPITEEALLRYAPPCPECGEKDCLHIMNRYASSIERYSNREMQLVKFACWNTNRHKTRYAKEFTMFFELVTLDDGY